MTKNTNTLAVIAMVIAQIFWGVSYLLSDYALHVFQPSTLTALRMLIAATVLGSFGLITGQLKMIRLKDFKYFLLGAFCEPFVYFLCEAEALTRVSPTVVSVVLSFIPLFTPLFAFLIIREKVTLMNIIGIVVSLAGVMMIILNREGKLEADIMGLVFLMISMLASITYALTLRKIPSDYNIITIVFFMFCTSLLFFVPTALIRDMDAIMAIDFSARITHNAIWTVIGLSLSSSCIAFLFFSFGIRVLGATRGNAFCNIQPGVTAIFAWLLAVFTGQPSEMTLVKWIGIVVVIVGMFLSQIDIRKAIRGYRAKRG